MSSPDPHSQQMPMTIDEIPTDRPIMFIDDNSFIRSGTFERYNEEEWVFELRLPDWTLCRVKELRLFNF